MDLIDYISEEEFRQKIGIYKEIVAQKMKKNRLTSLAVRANTFIKKEFTDSSVNFLINKALNQTWINPQ